VSQRATADLARIVVQRTRELAAVPAPTGAEQRRAAILSDWWTADGLAPRVDSVGNVWAVAAPGDGPAILICAHLDTVFGPEVRHEVRMADGRMTGPGVGDDTVAVAALSAVGSLLAGGRGPIWLVATVGEEGAGNLAGIRHALATPPQPVSAVIAVEGNYLGRVVNVSVGSVRWRVGFSGPGGHAWEQSTAPSAVHAAAAAAAGISALTVPGARCSTNIGSIGGGEAINARARSAWFEADLRADAPDALGELESRARDALTATTPAGITARITDIGRRPAGQTAPSHPLVRAAVSALERAGLPAELGAASTDANAAHAAGLPAVALGVTRGAGEHTPHEWIETGPIGTGLETLADTIRLFREASQ
jgi:tripeptide aminopeptidase